QKAVELIKIHTRQYAKRQLTWFKRDGSIEWAYNNSITEIIENIEKKLQQSL
ncbi:MAG: tRNA (adenosine(37)-N6)-dimethylallyltransferase MiaA, partial [Chitinophagaceae bacterium]